MKNRFTIQQRLILPIILLGVLALISSALSVFSINNVNSNASKIVDNYMVGLETLHNIRHTTTNIHKMALSHIVATDYNTMIIVVVQIKEEEKVGVKSLPVSTHQIKELKGVHKMLIIGKPALIDKIIPSLVPKFPNLDFVKSAPHLLEIVLKSVNKGNAVKIVLDSFAMDKSNAWAFGDNYNDESMFNSVGHPVLMGNAPKNLKESLSIPITLDNDHDGIAAVLNKIPN